MKGLLRNLFLAAAAVLVMLLAAESVIRSRRPFDLNHRAFVMRYDPVLGWSKIPRLAGVYSPGEGVEVLNWRGLRGRDYPYAKPADEYRILLLGDAFAEGRDVRFRDTMPEVLERKLRETRRDPLAEVINAGTGGYSTDQALLFFTTEGRKYSPDLTVLMFHENDVWQNAQPRSSRGAKPLFKLQDGDLVLTGVPVKRPGARDSSEPASGIPALAGRLVTWLGVRSALYQFVRDSVQVLPVGAPSGSVPDEFRVWQRRYDDQTRYAWRVTAALLRGLQRETREAGSELVVLYVPAAAEIHPEIWAATRERYGLSEAEWDITRLEHRLAAVCRRNDIRYVNLAPHFRAETERAWLERSTTHYFASNSHWVPADHALVGTMLASYVERAFVLDRTATAMR